MLANIGKFAGFLTLTSVTVLAIFLRYYRRKTGVKSVAVDFEVIHTFTIYIVTLDFDAFWY